MPSKPYPRSRRVAQQIQQALSELIRRELRDPRLGMVTLTEVRLSRDLSYARVYYSVMGTDAELAQEILEGAAGRLRGPLGRALGIRHSPELRFMRDELIESGARLSALIRQAVEDDAARRVDDEPNEPPKDVPGSRQQASSGDPEAPAEGGEPAANAGTGVSPCGRGPAPGPGQGPNEASSEPGAAPGPPADEAGRR